MHGKVFSKVLYGSRQILSAVFDFAKKKYSLQIATYGPTEIWQDHQIVRAGGPMVHCLEMYISSPDMCMTVVHQGKRRMRKAKLEVARSHQERQLLRTRWRTWTRGLNVTYQEEAP